MHKFIHRWSHSTGSTKSSLIVLQYLITFNWSEERGKNLQVKSWSVYLRALVLQNLIENLFIKTLTFSVNARYVLLSVYFLSKKKKKKKKEKKKKKDRENKNDYTIKNDYE